ncbi:MAG: hypothetical protein Q8P50_10665 [Bacillota bacterium]|nr:hypothetical protein [Bacillota bacterium]
MVRYNRKWFLSAFLSLCLVLMSSIQVAEAAVGDAYWLGSGDYTNHDISRTNSAQLLYSNNPENVPAVYAGKQTLLFGKVCPSGSSRIFLAHTNSTGQSIKLGIVVAPYSGGSVTVTISKRGIADPSTDYPNVGKQAEQRWFPSAISEPVTATTYTQLDSSLPAKTLTNSQNINAIYDVSANAQFRMWIVAVPSSQSILTGFPNFYWPTESGRDGSSDEDFKAKGIFRGERMMSNSSYYAYDTAQGIRRIRIGHFFDSDSTNDTLNTSSWDGWMPTTVGETGIGEFLPGNYGALYRFELRVKSTDGRRLAVLIRPRCNNTVAGAANMGGSIVGYGPYSSINYGYVLSEHTLGSSETVIWFNLMPAANSFLPQEIILYPY